jgi:hypothetical protein
MFCYMIFCLNDLLETGPQASSVVGHRPGHAPEATLAPFPEELESVGRVPGPRP